MLEEVWWSPVDERGLEHLRMRQDESGVFVESTILRMQDGEPFHLDYKIRCDAGWRVRKVEVNLQSGAKREIKLSGDGAGNWTNETGKILGEFAGCFDVDISATPFTNALPIRRAKLETGASVDISAVYILVPEMTVRRSSQRYTRLETNLFRFEEKGVFDGFTADLPVDANGFVIDYPGLFKRLKI